MNLWNAAFLLCTISLLTIASARKSKVAPATPISAGPSVENFKSASGLGNSAGSRLGENAGLGKATGAEANAGLGNNAGVGANSGLGAGSGAGLGATANPGLSGAKTAAALAKTKLAKAKAISSAAASQLGKGSSANPNKAINAANKLLGRKKNKGKNSKKQLLQRQKKILRYYRIIGVNKKVPTIGVLCGPQPIDDHMKMKQAKCDHHTVHWLYQSGAEIVPILPWLKDHELDHLLSKIHGVVFPSGRRKLMKQHSYEKFAKVVFSKVKELNDKGVYTPLFGIGQGFELLHLIVGQSDKVLQPIKGTDKIMLPEFIWKNPNSHKILSLFDKTDLFNFKFRRTTAHFHKLGISPFQYKVNPFLKNFFKITSYGVDATGKVFISGVEAKKYPFFGVHFQPEQVPWNKIKTDNIINSTEAVRISQKYGNFFVQECRKNPNFTLPKKDFKSLGGFNIRSRKIVKRKENYYWFFNAPNSGLKAGQILPDWHNPKKKHDPSEKAKKIKKLAAALNKLTNKAAPPAKLLPRAMRSAAASNAGTASNSLPPMTSKKSEMKKLKKLKVLKTPVV